MSFISIPRKSAQWSWLLGVWEGWLVAILQAWPEIKIQSDLGLLTYKGLSVIVCVKREIMVVQLTLTTLLEKLTKAEKKMSRSFTLLF